MSLGTRGCVRWAGAVSIDKSLTLVYYASNAASGGVADIGMGGGRWLAVEKNNASVDRAAGG